MTNISTDTCIDFDIDADEIVDDARDTICQIVDDHLGEDVEELGSRLDETEAYHKGLNADVKKLALAIGRIEAALRVLAPGRDEAFWAGEGGSSGAARILNKPQEGAAPKN